MGNNYVCYGWKLSSVFPRIFLAIFSHFFTIMLKNGQFCGKIGDATWLTGTIRDKPQVSWKPFGGNPTWVRIPHPAWKKDLLSKSFFQRNKSLAGFVKYAPRVKYAYGVWNALRRDRGFISFHFAAVPQNFTLAARQIFHIERSEILHRVIQ